MSNPPMTTLTRRRFGAVAAALALGARHGARGADEAAGFAFFALGDAHFDRPEHHDFDWLRRDHPGDVRQVETYSRITREVTPALFAELRRRAADASSEIACVAQLGDFVEGMCGAPELARTQCEEAVAFVRGAHLGVPFLMAKGNHEIQGPGAREAFDAVLRPFVADQLGRPLDRGASFAVRRGGALLAFFDAYDPDALDWLARTLEDHGPADPARPAFVLLHPPVVPFGARSTWHLYARPQDQDRRRRLLDLLGAHRAIVLSAHLHKFGVVVRDTPAGRFLQLALNSVLPRPDVEPRDRVEGVARYGPDLVALEPSFSPATEAERRATLRAEAPFIVHFEYADAPGYARLTVRGPRVSAEIHAGLGRPPWKTLDLSALLEGRVGS
jgi:hypothetical protein